MALSGIVSPFASLLSAFLIRRGILSKRAVLSFGLFALGSCGIFSLILHRHFLCLGFLGALIGLAVGCYSPTITSVMVDSFSGDECRKLAGYQAVFMGIGAAALSISCGFLTKKIWFSGYLLLSVALPVAALSLLAVPGIKTPARNTPSYRSSLPHGVLYYALAVFLLLFIFSVGTGNISVHFGNAGIKRFALAAGFAAAVQMLGSALFGLCFRPLSERLGDMLIPLSFLLAGSGLLILDIFDYSLPLMYLGIAVIGMSMAVLSPQCILSVSQLVDETTSAPASALLNSVAPGLGTFLSPVIITNMTTVLAGNDTGFRYRFTAILSFLIAAAFYLSVRSRARKKTTSGKG